METLRQRLAEQKDRHQGGSKWIGTGGTSPFGAYGYNPEGVRIGQDESRHRRAVKVWDKREFRDLDGDVELGTRNIKLALRRLRRFARQGAATELDLPGTIRATANNAGHARPEAGAGAAQRGEGAAAAGYRRLDGRARARLRRSCSRRRAASSSICEYYYFHNCPYERVWRDNRRAHEQQHADLRGAAHLRARLQADLRRRRQR